MASRNAKCSDRSRELWLWVSKDEYELPIAVADTIEELAAIRGVKVNSIKSAMSRAKRGQLKHVQYRKVRI